MEPRIVKGCPRDKWEEVQAIQHEPFIYIHSNGSRWAGEEEGDIDELLDVLKTHKLRQDSWSHYSVNPCAGIRNQNAKTGEPWTEENPHWIDGPRLYACDGVYRFSGNFEMVSHVFCIETNHQPTIDALLAAFKTNAELVPGTVVLEG